MFFNDFENLFNDSTNNRDNQIKKIIEQLLNFSKPTERFEGKLGEPTKVEQFEEGGYTFEKQTWVTEAGVITKIEMVDTPFKHRPSELNLEAKLAKAIEEERYEDAAKIRDEIKRNKTTLDNIVGNKATNYGEDEWNF
jgi:excinuclease UvrABC helicase subunit UvrB